MPKIITVGDYLLYRLKEMGIKHIFGVPGDYNLGFVDHIDRDEELAWIGTCNELNAAYAADGYARLNGIAAISTVFGPGELSALNGIAGAYAERVPLVVITGAPATRQAQQRAVVHHTLGDGNFTHFATMFKEITVAQTQLTPENAAAEIDRVLDACWLEKRPVYIALPLDVCEHPLPTPQMPLALPEYSSDPEMLAAFLKQAIKVLEAARHPLILADYEVNRYHLSEELLAFLNATGFPFASLSMGKGVVDETHPQAIGVYAGALSSEQVKQSIGEADCIFSIGVQLTDLTSGMFTQTPPQEKMIELHPLGARIHSTWYQDVAMKDVLTQLTQQVEQKAERHRYPLAYAEGSRESFTPPVSRHAPFIEQQRFWQRLSHFFKEDDVLLVDMGTAFSGAVSVPLPAGATMIAQPLWSSIGYSLPAAVGTALASPCRRHIAVIGDGAFQMTVQELSTALHHNLPLIIFLVNNDGYTIERLIHGREKKYNDLSMWRYHRLPALFGGVRKSLCHQVTTEDELDAALQEAEHSPNMLHFIEVVMGREDAPEWLNALCDLLAKQHSYQGEENRKTRSLATA
ncbi:MAG: alpha-keto acid decarboxylase family protein [Ktedonobacteraceae bacterium]|nr:alpha-keto acid decarboxylase family protein [Ktedonobacteraceae bacterium]